MDTRLDVLWGFKVLRPELATTCGVYDTALGQHTVECAFCRRLNPPTLGNCPGCGAPRFRTK